MEKKLVEKSNKILTEIKELEEINRFLTNKEYKTAVNFVIKQHFGNTWNSDEEISINIKHTPRLMKIIRTIISELEVELANL